MTYQGIDTVARITASQAQKLRENGVSFVGRYLTPAGYSKGITKEEIAILRGAGLAILLCWELNAEAMKEGATRGAHDGTQARKAAEALGVPAGTTIYFAADYNVPTSDLIQCEQYMLAAQAAIGGYVAGIYGGEKVVEFLTLRKVKRAWQCVAWSNKFCASANVRQYAWQGAEESKEMAAKCGILAVDMDSCEDMKRAGLWMPYNEYDDGDGGTIVEPAEPWYVKNGTLAWGKKEGIITDERLDDKATRGEVLQMLRNYNRRFEAEDTKTDSGLLS